MKLEKVDDYLVSIAIGIRFRPNFSLEDRLGSLVDGIIYTKNSFFGPEFFPTTQAGLNERVLINKESGNALTLNTTDIILEIKLPNPGDISSLKNVIQAYKRQIVDGVMKEFNINNISRIGFLRRYDFPLLELSKSFLSQTLGGSPEDVVSDINLQFSKRYSKTESLTTKEILDYTNIICNIVKRAETDNLFIFVDYQWYFKPFLEGITQLDFDEFIEKANAYNRDKFPEWVNTKYLLK